MSEVCVRAEPLIIISQWRDQERMDWHSGPLVRSVELPDGVQISCTSDGPTTILSNCTLVSWLKQLYTYQVCRQVEKIMDIMRDADIEDGMFPTRWAVSNALPLNGV